MQCRPALTFVVGAIFGATVVLVTDDKRMSRIRPLRRAADVGPRDGGDASGASRSTTPAAPGRRLAARSDFAADCAGNDACERTLEESAALAAAAAEFKEQKITNRTILNPGSYYVRPLLIDEIRAVRVCPIPLTVRGRSYYRCTTPGCPP